MPSQTRPYVRGRRLVIAGYGSFGPYVEPTPVASPEEAGAIFGGDLAVAAANAFAAGAEDVVLVRVHDCSTRGELFLAMEDVYDVLLPLPADVLLLLPVVYGEDFEEGPSSVYGSAVYGEAVYGRASLSPSEDELLWQALDFASKRLAQAMPVVEICSVSPFIPPGELLGWCRNKRPEFVHYVDAEPMEFGEHLSIVVSCGIYPAGAAGTRLLSAAASYAGLVASLDPWVSPTNKEVLGVQSVSPDLSEEEAAELASLGFVALTSTVRRGVAPYAAVTAARGLYSRQVNVRLRNYIVQLISSAVSPAAFRRRKSARIEPFVESGVASVMDSLVEIGAVKSYAFDYSVAGGELWVSVEAVRHGEVAAVKAFVRERL